MSALENQLRAAFKGLLHGCLVSAGGRVRLERLLETTAGHFRVAAEQLVEEGAATWHGELLVLREQAGGRGLAAGMVKALPAPGEGGA